MSPALAQAVYAAQHQQTADSIRLSLPDLADGLQAQLVELHKRPSADAAEQLARNLDGARVAVMRYRERLIAEGTGDGR